MNLLCGPEIMPIGQDLCHCSPLPGLTLSTRRFGRLHFRNRPGRHLSAPRRRRPGGSVLIVMISMDGMPMSFVDEVSMVTVLHCRVPAARCMLVRVAFGDRMRSYQLIVV